MDVRDILHKAPLFRGMDDDEISRVLEHLACYERSYAKGTTILDAGVFTDHFGILEEGTLTVEQNDFWGNRNLMAQLVPGLIFAESFACSFPRTTLAVSVVAASDVRVLWVDGRKLSGRGSVPEDVWNRFITNFMTVLSNKNVRFNEKVSHMGMRTTREKLLSYLSLESRKQKSESFDIPYNRQELADYLGVERSAMSTALGALKRDGLIDFDKSHFELKERV